MTLALTYNDDLARIQISVTDLPFETGTASIERSVNGLLWTSVRGASKLQVIDGAATVDDYEFVTDVPNFYRRVAGVLDLPGSGSYVSTPNHESLHITGDITLSADIAPDAWASGEIQYVLSRYDTTGGQRSYALRISADGDLEAAISPDGLAVSAAAATAPIPAADGERLAVRATVDVDNGSGGHDFTFWTGPTMAGPWAQLGDTVAVPGATSIHAGAADLVVSGRNGGTVAPFAGRVYAVEVGSEAGVVSGLYFAEFAPGDSSLWDSQGRSWAVHGDAVLVGEPLPAESITPSLGGKAWLKSIKHPFLNRPIHRALAGGGQDIGRGWRGGVHEVQGRSAPIAVTDVRSSREFTLTVQVPDEQAAAEMDLILASGDVFFIQVPPELAPHMAGGYVRIGATAQHRVADTIRWRFTLPCKVIAPPGPGVVGAPLTWGTVFNLYGSYEAMWAANPTWASLLSTVGSPDDLVVLP